ncbi:hypothetical protein ES703_113135 [subsurface metagenome]
MVVARDDVAGFWRGTPDRVVGCIPDAHAMVEVAPFQGASDIGANEVAHDLVPCRANAVDFDAGTAVAHDDVARPDRVAGRGLVDEHTMV